MTAVLDTDLSEYYRQRGRWFLLLGALLGGIIIVALCVAFALQEWGRHITPDSHDLAYQIAVAFAVGLVVVAVVVALIVWRATTYLRRAQTLDAALAESHGVSEPVVAAVAAWTSAAVSRQAPDADQRESGTDTS